MTPAAAAKVGELAERCEAATGPDRELDLAIWQVRYPRDYETTFSRLRGVMARGSTDEEVLERLKLGVVRPYTASIDAAMTLVPKGMILRRYMVTRFVPHGCEVGIDYAHGGWVGHSDHSLALALCAAALRARGESQ